MEYVRAGDIAPDFTALDQNGENVSLSDFRDKNPVVLIFYPGDETPGCTKQLCSARDDFDKYESAGVKVFGVNQGSQASHQKFIARHNLKTPLLIDNGLAISAKYDAVLGFGPLKLINRTVVAIDKAGKIVFYERGAPNTNKILASLGKVEASA